MRKFDLSNRFDWLKFCKECLTYGFESATNDALTDKETPNDGDTLCEKFVLGTYTKMHRKHAESLFSIGYMQGKETLKHEVSRIMRDME